MGLLLAACGSDSMPAATIDAPLSSGASPVISKVSWVHAAGCSASVPHQVTVTVDATDSDTPAGNLTYSGGWPSCTGAITGPTSTITCPEAFPYSGSVSVKDPENHSTSKGGQIMPCVNGMVQ
jgi:hypothetical protein